VPARIPLPPAARLLAAHQGGVISRRQLADGGVSARTIERLVDEGVLYRVTPGILAHGPELRWEGRAWAGVLIGGPHAVVGMAGAARLWGLLQQPPDEIAIFAPVARAFRPGWRFIKARRLGVREPPRTRVEETLLDLCAEADSDQIAALLADAVSGHRTTEKRLREQLARRVTLPHRHLIREILGDVAGGAHSSLERRYLVNVERDHALPTAKRQQQVAGSHRCDAWYEEYRVLLELDSRLHHSGGAAFRDMNRDNDHALAGILTLRVGWQQVSGTVACETAWLLGRALMSRGWDGPIQPCLRCRNAHPV